MCATDTHVVCVLPDRISIFCILIPTLLCWLQVEAQNGKEAQECLPLQGTRYATSPSPHRSSSSVLRNGAHHTSQVLLAARGVKIMMAVEAIISKWAQLKCSLMWRLAKNAIWFVSYGSQATSYIGYLIHAALPLIGYHIIQVCLCVLLPVNSIGVTRAGAFCIGLGLYGCVVHLAKSPILLFPHNDEAVPKW